jgi:hypothetical protein
VGNLIPHLVYGAVLGWSFGLEPAWQEAIVHRAASPGGSQESSLAIGIVSGALLGGLVGWALGATVGSESTSALAAEPGLALVGALFGSASGAILGPLFGMGRSG